MPAAPQSPRKAPVATPADAKPGSEAIFIGPAFVTFLGAAAIVAALSFDRWYMTSRIGTIWRYGLFQTCTYEQCLGNEFASWPSTASCPASGETWEPRSVATIALLAAGLLALVVAFGCNAYAAVSRNMVYFGYNVVALWAATLLLAAGGGVQNHLFNLHLFCGVGYCRYAMERFGNNLNCDEAQGISIYLWFVGVAMVVANAFGNTVLCFLWRQRLSTTWAMMGAKAPKAVAGAAGAATGGAAAAAAAAAGTEFDDEAVPVGYVWDRVAGYYYSESQGWFYDAPTQQFYDPESGCWYDPVNQVWQ